MTYLDGSQYTDFCSKCQKAVDDALAVITEFGCEGFGMDDEETPCNMVFDTRQFCNDDGSRCQLSEDLEDLKGTCQAGFINREELPKLMEAMRKAYEEDHCG